MVISLLVCVLLASIYGWWATWRDYTVTIALLREELAESNSAMTISERLRQNRAEAIRMRTDLTRMQAEAFALTQRITQRTSWPAGGDNGGTRG